MTQGRSEREEEEEEEVLHLLAGKSEEDVSLEIACLSPSFSLPLPAFIFPVRKGYIAIPWQAYKGLLPPCVAIRRGAKDG